MAEEKTAPTMHMPHSGLIGLTSNATGSDCSRPSFFGLTFFYSGNNRGDCPINVDRDPSLP